MPLGPFAGNLSLVEMKQMLTELRLLGGQANVDEAAAALMARWDDNADGRIDFEEFKVGGGGPLHPLVAACLAVDSAALLWPFPPKAPAPHSKGVSLPLPSVQKHFNELMLLKRDIGTPPAAAQPGGGASSSLSLEFAKCIGYKQVYNDKGTGARLDGSVWRPVPPPGFFILGYAAKNDYIAPENLPAVRDPAPGGKALALPLSYQRVWTNKGAFVLNRTGGRELAIFKPVAPEVTEEEEGGGGGEGGGGSIGLPPPRSLTLSPSRRR